MPRRRALAAKSCLALLLLAACSNERAAPAPAPTAAPARREPRPDLAIDSTIRARDYIGPAACGECHPDQHVQWSTSLHSVMNQRAEGGAVIGDFATTLAYAGGEVRFARERGAPTMTLRRGGATVRYLVTRTIGRRGLQEYVGIEEGGPGDEVRLPFGWWPRRGGWYPQPYFDPWLAEDDVDPYAPVREPWAERCPWCHSTYPFEQRISRASGPRGVGHGFAQQFTSAPGGDRLDVARQVTIGISCESCHLGGRAHADGAPIHFVPIGAAPRPGAFTPTTFAAERRDPAIVSAVCTQCHSGPSPKLPDGSSLRNSSEGLDLAASPCTSIRCTDCHDPHRGGIDEARAVAACTGCHPAAAVAGPAHAGAGHDQVSCLDCHMPRIVMGIDRYVRSHRISSPTDPAMLAAAVPNACNLCHLDRSIQWTTDELRLRYDVRLDPRRWTAYGELDAPVGEVWLASPQPAIRLIATAAYARSPLGRYVWPQLLRGLADPLPHVRIWTLFAIEELLGRKLRDAEYDPRAPSAERARQLRALHALTRR